VKWAVAGFGSDKRNNRFQELMQEYDIERLKPHEFEFV
jgi:hypothetical protein